MKVLWRKYFSQKCISKVEWQSETHKKNWEKGVGKGQMVQSNGTGWDRLQYVGQVGLVQVGFYQPTNKQMEITDEATADLLPQLHLALHSHAAHITIGHHAILPLHSPCTRLRRLPCTCMQNIVSQPMQTTRSFWYPHLARTTSYMRVCTKGWFHIERPWLFTTRLFRSFVLDFAVV